MEKRSKQVRRDTIALSKANGGYHYGGCFSCIEILIALYDNILKENDKFILSKGHACWPYYVLLREHGYTPKLQGHPSRDAQNGIWCTTGSEGHGFPTGIGIAMAKKITGDVGKVYVLIGDGECQEGTTWESLLTAAHHSLANFTVIIDWNLIQGSGFVADILSVSSLDQIAKLIGWDIYHVDGHSCKEILSADAEVSSKPKLIIAHTVKGKGVSYMEGNPKWHACWPDADHEKQALEELGE